MNIKIENYNDNETYKKLIGSLCAQNMFKNKKWKIQK
jgi:hypothetical protein